MTERTLKRVRAEPQAGLVAMASSSGTTGQAAPPGGSVIESLHTLSGFFIFSLTVFSFFFRGREWVEDGGFMSYFIIF